MKCSVLSCCNLSSRMVPGLSFHRFPKDEDRKALWMKAIKQPNLVINMASSICSEHFKPEDLLNLENRTRLSQTAVPALKIGDCPPPAPKPVVYENENVIIKTENNTVVIKTTDPVPVKKANIAAAVKPDYIKTENNSNEKVYGPSTQESQMNAVRKIHNLLSSGVVTVTGPTQPRILKKTTTISSASSSTQSGIHNNNQSNSVQQVTISTARCYICDEPSGNQASILHETLTAHTNTTLPKKIGQLLGEGFTVIVSLDDVVCKRCLNMINTFDRLDVELSRVKTSLLNFLFRKYSLSEDDRQTSSVPASPPTKMQKLNSGTVISRKVNVNEDDPDMIGGNTRKIVQTIQNRDSIDNQLSNIFEESDKAGVTQVMKTRTVAQIMPQPQAKKTQPKGYKCISCDFQTSELKHFQNHYETCKQMALRCKVCKRTFTSGAALKQHMNDKHSNEFICTLCNVMFTNEFTLKRHMEATHSEGKIEQNLTQSYSCNMCQYKTTDKQNYDEHLKKHIKVKPFKCRICSMRFETREQASTHSKTHQPTYFKCATCAASFPQRELLVKHFETHQQASKPNVTQTAAMTTQKLLQDTIDEALRTDNLETKGIHFFSCNICSLTFLQENYYNQHMETHKSENKKQNVTTTTSSPQSLIRQEVRNSNANILTATTQASNMPEVDIESIFEKMHSDKTETEGGNSNSGDNLVITSQENAGGITFNITIPDNPNQIKKIATTESLESSAQNSTVSVGSVGIDMPVLDQPEESNAQRAEQKSVQGSDGEQQDQAQPAPVSMPSLDDEGDSQSQPSNTDQVPMDLEDIQNSVESGQIKFILNENGQILQLDNHIITTDAEGNQILVQGSEQIQQLLQSVGVLQTGDGLDGETLQMIGDNNQMIIVQQGDNEAQLIDASLLNADGHIVIQQAQEGELPEGAHTISEDGVRIPVSVAFTSHEQAGENIGIADVQQQEHQDEQAAQMNSGTELTDSQEQKTDNSNQTAGSASKTEQSVTTTQSLPTSTGETFFALEELMQQSDQKASD